MSAFVPLFRPGRFTAVRVGCNLAPALPSFECAILDIMRAAQRDPRTPLKARRAIGRIIHSARRHARRARAQ